MQQVAIPVGLLSYIPAFVSFDDVALRIDSFIVCNVMESGNALLSRVIANSTRSLQVPTHKTTTRTRLPCRQLNGLTTSLSD